MYTVPFTVLRLYIEVVDSTLQYLNDPSFGFKSGDFTFAALWETLSNSNPIAFTLVGSVSLIFLSLPFLFLVIVSLIAAKMVRAQWRRMVGPVGNPYALAAETALAVHRAMQAYRRPPGSVAQQEALRVLAVSLRGVYRDILNISDKTVTVRRDSRRKNLLREHHLKVIGALEVKESAIDVNARIALPDLAETLTRIVNAYSAGKIGQLLPASEIDHVIPFEPVQRERERFKMVAVALLLGGCGVLVAFLDLPDTATTSLIGAIGIAIVAIVYGRKARQGLDLLDSVRGIQRP
ncbi:hypothetical protein [Streptomyces sp. SCL15-6]|uniref:hypothetical protein n=1 Tax=Streptomyces sp. SCL15-6 TaxID=2967222 RepID=UPI00296668FE|nr:hypothetical protein [Streptomyces sp. SCL15-6]